MDWISVKDKLPEHNEVVLAKFDTMGVSWYTYPTNVKLLAFHIQDEYTKWFKDKSSLRPVNSSLVTHWMPLPKQ
jgi:Protein of unknown function (DUF551)